MATPDEVLEKAPNKPANIQDGQVETKHLRDSSISSAKILDAAIASVDLAPNSVTADKLSQVLVLVSKIIAGTISGYRIELDSTQGLVLFDPSGNIIVKLPLVATSAYFKGTIDDTGGTINGADLLGNTDIVPAATVTIDSAVTNPGGSPSISTAWPTSVGWSPGEADHWGGYYDPAGDAGGATPTIWTCTPGAAGADAVYRYIREYRASDGLLLREIDIQGSHDGAGICRIGTTLYVLQYRENARVYELLRFNQATLAQTAPANDITSDVDPKGYPGMFYDGTNICVITTNPATGAVILRKYDSTTAPVTTQILSGVTLNRNLTELSGGVKLTEAGVNGGSAVYWISTYDGTVDTITAFDVGAGTTISNVSFGAATAASGAVDCLVHDGTNFWSAVWAGNLYRHSNWLYTTESPIYWVGYTWYDGAGTTHETKISPRATVTQPRRAYLQVSTPTIPAGGADDPDRVRIYMERGSSDPGAGAEKLQVTTGVGVNTASLSTFATAGAADPGTNTFVTTTPGRIVAGTQFLSGDGGARWDTLMPPGAILAYGGSAAPSGFVLCDGGAISRTTFAVLFAAIGTAYGVGNGTTTFNVPDLRGAFPVGKNAGTFPTLGGTGGEEAHTLVTAEMPAHQHGGNTGVASNAVDDASGAALALAGAGVQSSFNTSHHHAIGSEGGGGAHQNLPPYQVVNYIIKTGV